MRSSYLKITEGQNEYKKYHKSVRQNILEFQFIKEHNKREKDKVRKIYFALSLILKQESKISYFLLIMFVYGPFAI